MESFSADWLALREPADHAARPADLATEMAVRLATCPSRRAVDLACGTGSNVRYLLPRLPHITHWTLVDHDPVLLAEAMRSLEPLGRAHGVSIDACRQDLRVVGRLPLDECALVTAAALLDLVSREWLDALVERCGRAGAGVLFALSYDGRIECDPFDTDDARVRALVNRHQHTDKGFGPALGPDSSVAAAQALAGWAMAVATSDWRLTPTHGELQRQLVEGWADAARAIAPEDASAIAAWHTRRLSHIDAGRSSIRVGHRDVAAWNRPSGVSIGPVRHAR